jgi:hypothetical protein
MKSLGAVATRLECGDNKERCEAKLEKLAKRKGDPK